MQKQTTLDYFSTMNDEGNSCEIYLIELSNGCGKVLIRERLPAGCWYDQPTTFGTVGPARAYFENIREGKIVRGFQNKRQALTVPL